MKRIIKLCAAGLLLLGAAFAAYRIYTMASAYSLGQKSYAEVQQAVQFAPQTPQSGGAEKSAVKSGADAAPESAAADMPVNPDFPLIDFDMLTEQNPDTVGWIYIDGTHINYPVVRGTDNRKYVTTLFDGRENQAGSIFMDWRSSPDLSDTHTIIYGHNMGDKSMFGDLTKYQKQEYLDSHARGMFITPSETTALTLPQLTLRALQTAPGRWNSSARPTRRPGSPRRLRNPRSEARLCPGRASASLPFRPAATSLTMRALWCSAYSGTLARRQT